MGEFIPDDEDDVLFEAMPAGDPVVIRQSFVRGSTHSHQFHHADNDEMIYVAHWADGQTREFFAWSQIARWQHLIRGFEGEPTLDQLSTAVKASGARADSSFRKLEEAL